MKTTVIIPAYNGECYLKEAIHSVVKQSHHDVQLIIVNDGSTDGTAKLLETYNDVKNISVINQENQGVSVARNTGLQHAKGDFVLFLDADDTLPPDSIKSRLDKFEQNPNLDICGGHCQYFKDIDDKLWLRKTQFKGMPHKEILQFNDQLGHSLSWMWRRAAASKYRFEAGMTHGEDWLFNALNSPNCEFDYVDEVVLNYRVGHGSAMDNIRGIENGYERFVQVLSRELSQSLLSTKLKITSIMFKTYLKKGQLWDAIRMFNRYLWL